jgi:hypothetical protein
LRPFPLLFGLWLTLRSGTIQNQCKDPSFYLANGVPACELRQRRWQRSRIFIHEPSTPPNTPDEQRSAEAASAKLGFAFVFHHLFS